MLLQSSTFLIHFLSFYLSLTLSLSLSSQHSFPEESDSRQKRIFRENPNPDPKDPLRIYPHILLAWPWKSDPNLKIPFSDFKVSLSLSLSFFSWKHNTIIFRLKKQPLFISFSSTFVLSHLDFTKKRKKNKTKKYPFDDPESRVFIRWLLGFL